MADIKNLNNDSVRFEGGNNAAPGIAFIGDPNTGIFQSAADTLQIGVGGGEKVRVNNNGVGVSAGNLYIATDYRMNFDYGVSNNYYLQKSSTTMYMHSPVNLSLQTNGNHRLYINQPGNVGIGTTSPSAKLDVVGTSEFNGQVNVVDSPLQMSDAYYLRWGGSTRIYGSTTSNLIAFETAATERMRIKDGNVGIGTTVPTAKLHVEGNAFIKNNLHVEGELTIGKISNDSALVDVGGNFNFDTVAEVNTTDAVNFVATILNVAGNINNGSHTYTIIYKTDDGGETGAYGSSIFKTITIVDNTTAGQVELTGIPVSTDARVVARDIYRSSANDSPYYGKKLATINDNTTTTYVDNLSDSALDQNTLFYRKANTTAGVFYINNGVVMQAPNAHRTSLGVGALSNNTIGQDNVAVGGSALQVLTSGKQNTAVGYGTGSHSIDGQNNTFIGYSNGYFNDSGDWNTYVGSFAGRNVINTTNNYNTGIGGGALNGLTLSNSWNTALGYEAGKSFQGAWNIHIGYQSGIKSTATPTGNFNINLGAYSGRATTGSNNVVIGYGIEVPTPSGSNQLNIGNLIYATGLSSLTTASTGNVGIGTTAPESKLHVAGGDVLISNGQYYTAESSTGGNYKIAAITTGNVVAVGAIDYTTAGTIFAGGDNVSITTGGITGSSRLYINSSGNVGIGTTSPSTKLEVSSSGAEGILISKDTGTPSNSGRLFFETDTVSEGFSLLNSNGLFTIRSQAQAGVTSGNTRVAINGSGNVGIGTTSPIQKLQVAGSAYVNGGTLFLDTNQFLMWGNSNQGIRAVSDGSMSFRTGGSETVTVEASGNVGIGTTSPASELHIADISDEASIILERIDTSMSVNRIGALYFRAGESTVADVASIQAWADGTWTDDDSPSYLTFYTTPDASTTALERIRIGANGNVGIGTTTPSRHLHIHANTGSAYLQLTQASTGITDNDGFQITMGAAQVNLINRENGNMVFETNNTEKLRITSSGNVGIGTSSPSYPLHVAGDIFSSSRVIGDDGISTKGVFKSWSVYSYSDGILIQTDIDVSTANAWDNRMIMLTAYGMTYSNEPPITASFQCYNYNNSQSIIARKGISTDESLTMDVFHYNGKVCFFMEQTGNYQTWHYELQTMGYYHKINSISNVAKPSTGITNDYTITPVKWWHSDNDGTGSGLDADLLDGLEATAFATAAQGTKADTAHGWGDHSSAGYAPLASPALTGTPTAPTAGSTTNNTQLATTAFVQTAVSNLVDSAPGTLDTLNELAAALGDDANFSTTITNSIGTKLPLAGGTMTGNINLGDSNKVILGAGSDFEMFHNGSNTFLQTTTSSVGDFYITSRGSNHDLYLEAADDIFLRPQGNESGIDVIGNGAVKLYYDGAMKLETTDDGINVPGVAQLGATNFYFHDVGVGDADGLDVKWTLKNPNGNDVTSTEAGTVYRWGLVTLGTGTNTGAVYICDNIDGAGWRVKKVSSVDDGLPESNYPFVEIDGGLPKVTIQHNNTYSVRVIIEAFYGGNGGASYTMLGLDSGIINENGSVLMSLASTTTEASSVMINASGVLQKRDLGSLAFNSTTLGTAASSDTGDFAAASHNHDDRYYTETEINTGNITTSGTWTFNGVVNGLYHSVEEDHYYFDDYNGRRNVNAFLKTQYSDIVKFREIGAVEYWNGSAWVDGSSQLNNVKNLLDGRKDTNWYVPSTYYKFRFTVTSSTSWPTMSLIGVESSWTGSSYPGFQMLVEELQSDNSWLTRVTADFTSSNGVGNWGTMFKADTALHTGRGSQTYSTRITIDFDGWTPSNSSYNTIPLQNIFIYSNFSGIANNDYHNLLNYDRHVTAPNKLYITTTDTNTDSTTALVLNGTEVEKRTLGSLAFDSTTLGTAASSATTDFAAASHNQAWSTITGTPTTIAGYGITDALQIGTTATTALAGNTAIPVSGTDFDPVGTDNSTDVTLVTTSHDYLSLSGQAITLGAINLDDIYGGTTAGFLKTNASGVVSIDTSTYLTGIGANTVSITELDVTDGTNGQVLTTDGNGNLSFATVSTSSGTDLNYYLDGITRTASTDTLVFSVNGADDQSYTFGSLAFDSTTLGTAATAATGDFATAAQGSTADSALQPGDADLTPSWVPATDPSYLTSVAFSDLTTTPTTIAGYGITDALEIGTTATTALAGNTSIPVSGTDFDPAGTDNSTDVTLASVTGNYLSISGQEITAGTVPVALGGTGATTAADARTNLGVDAAGTDNSTDVTLVTTNHDYLSISGQAITLGSINLDDINGGTTAGILTTNTSGVISIDTNTYLTSYTESGNITTADSATNVFYAVPFVSTTAGSGKAVYKDANGFYYNPSTNNLSVGLLDLSDYGTAAAPAIRWSGDGDTGIFSGGSNSGIIGFSTQGTERMRINASGAVTLSNYGAGFLKTDANGLVSVDTTSYSTFDGAYSSLTGTPTLDNYVEWYLSGDADTQDITSGKWVKFEGASSITGLGTEVSPYIVDLSGINTDTQYTAGAGVTLSGTEFNVNSDLTGVVSSMGIDSNDKYVIKATTHEWSLDGTLEMRLSSDGVLDVDGDVVAFSTVTNSDRRLKTDIETIENAWKKVSKLRGVSYTWDHGKRKGQRDIGLIAQEVEEVVPEVVSEGQLLDGTTAKRVDYAKLVGLLIESNKELQAQVNELKDRLDAITK